MRAIIVTSNKEMGHNVYNNNILNKIRKEFDIENTIYCKADIKSSKNNFRITSYNVCYTKLLRKKTYLYQ